MVRSYMPLKYHLFQAFTIRTDFGRQTPHQIKGHNAHMMEVNVTHVAAGLKYTLCVDEFGQLLSWGAGRGGCLGTDLCAA